MHPECHNVPQMTSSDQRHSLILLYPRLSRSAVASLTGLCAWRLLSVEHNTTARSRASPHSSLCSLLDRKLLGDSREKLLDILGRLRTGLEEEEVGLSSICLGISSLDCTLVRLFCDEIELVACQGDDDVLVRLPLQLLDPRLCLVERCLRKD